MRVFLIIFILGLSLRVFAFPELTRFGYNTCTACHVAPSGGGLLSPYGKSLSSEVLSTWGTEVEGGFFHGALEREKLEKWLLVGGDLRAVQIHKEDFVQRTGRFIKMQADFSLGIVRDTWAVQATVGELFDDVWREVANQYYALWRPKDEVSIRGGRFIPQYGLLMMDHIAFIRSFMGFGLGAAKDSLEAQWTGTDWTFNLTSARQFNAIDPEKLWTSEVQYALSDKSKIGLQYLKGSSDSLRREAIGALGILSITPSVYWMFELDQQWKASTGAVSTGLVSYQKWGYSIFKGLDGFLLYETQVSDLSDSKTALRRWGPGIQFFPRPHFDFSVVWTKLQVQSPTAQESDYAWLLLHYYL